MVAVWLVGAGIPSPVAAQDGSSTVLRYVEGRDVMPSPMSAEEAAAELGDPFGRLLLASGDALPREYTDVLALIDGAGAGALAHPRMDVFLVSESGQILLSEAPDLDRRSRAVILRRSNDGRSAMFVAPSTRLGGTLEALSWDPSKRLFNFYERIVDRRKPGQPISWRWKGDSSNAWSERTRDHGCFRCHRNGGTVMKELRVPWQNWHSQSAAIKPEALPPDSPLRTDPLFRVSPPSPHLQGAGVLEPIVRNWNVTLNDSRVDRYKAGELSLRSVLAPLFRTTTMNLATSDVPSQSGPAVAFPRVFFFDDAGLETAAGLLCDYPPPFDDFSQAGPSVSRADYDAALRRSGFAFGDGRTNVRKPGDTHFALPTPERARVEVDLIRAVTRAGIVGKRFAATALMVDFANPVYSLHREALFALIPDWSAVEVAPDDVEPRLVDRFRAAARDSGLDRVSADAVAQFLDLWDVPAASWEGRACDKLGGYLGAVGNNLRAGNLDPYFDLLAARQFRFRASDHGLLMESRLLFPVAAHRDVVMRVDGTVGPPPKP